MVIFLLLCMIIAQVYVDGTTTMSTNERKASIREFYCKIDYLVMLKYVTSNFLILWFWAVSSDSCDISIFDTTSKGGHWCWRQKTEDDMHGKI